LSIARSRNAIQFSIPFIVRLFTRRRRFNWLKFKSTFPLRLYDIIGGACCNNNCTSRFLDTKEFDGSFHVLCVRHVIATWIRTSSTTFNSIIYFCHLFGFLPAQVAEFLSVSPSPFDATQIVDITHITSFRLLQHAHTHAHTHCSSEEKLGECCASGNNSTRRRHI
jgi:hypothetical protein